VASSGVCGHLSFVSISSDFWLHWLLHEACQC
jgi:hypothetical protein